MNIRIAPVALLVVGCFGTVEPDPHDVLVFPSANRIAVGDFASCALDSIQNTWCWGENAIYRQRGFETTNSFIAQTPAKSPIPSLVSLAEGGSQHRCGLTAEGTAVCWGRGTYGQLGRGTLDSTGNVPGVVVGGAKWRSIYTGRLHTCAIDKSGDAWCWGISFRGELGNNTPITTLDANRIPTPVPVAGGLKWKSLALGWQHTCGIAVNDTAYCWGDNRYGELGIGTADTTPHLSPVAVQGANHFTQLTASWRWTCGITTEKKAMCWGVNFIGQLGDGTTADRTTPGLVSGNHSFMRIAAAFTTGSFNTPLPGNGIQNGIQNAFGSVCALRDDGTPMCWGYNGDGQLGDGTTTSRSTPTAVAGDVKLTSLAMGTTHTCGMNGNAVWCWGSRELYQLGSPSNATFPPVLSPRAVAEPFDKP